MQLGPRACVQCKNVGQCSTGHGGAACMICLPNFLTQFVSVRLARNVLAHKETLADEWWTDPDSGQSWTCPPELEAVEEALLQGLGIDIHTLCHALQTALSVAPRVDADAGAAAAASVPSSALTATALPCNQLRGHNSWPRQRGLWSDPRSIAVPPTGIRPRSRSFCPGSGGRIPVPRLASAVCGLPRC